MTIRRYQEWRGCLIHGGKLVFAVGASVNVVRTRTGHQFVGHVVDGDCVLVVCRVLVALVGYFYEYGDIDTVSEPMIYARHLLLDAQQ
jgi:hypothetical protein